MRATPQQTSPAHAVPAWAEEALLGKQQKGNSGTDAKVTDAPLRVMHIVGARPNFPKLAPVFRAARRRGWEQVVVHTGQHYDESLSGSFFSDLELPAPDANLDVGSSSHAIQMARIIERLVPILALNRPEWVAMYGDVNSTLAAALAAAKSGIRIAHVEAGLRSGDRTMPEEINRIVTDHLADLLLTPTAAAGDNLLREGIPVSKIRFVGNVMIDSMYQALPAAKKSGYTKRFGADGSHVVVTLHRPSNVDDKVRLTQLIEALKCVARKRKVLFPAHPHTRERLASFGIDVGQIQLLYPAPYHGMLDLVSTAHCVITDSGGLQEETTALGVPCLTLRPNTERPITLLEGTNRLIHEAAELLSHVESATRQISPKAPAGWDGKAGDRVVSAISEHSSALSG